MSTATELATDLGGYAGQANLYQLDTPLYGNEHVVVWTQSFGTPEAVIVAAHPNGAAKTLNRLPGSYVGAEVTHSGALWLAGYEIVVPEPEPEPLPEENPEVP
ncbi:hypothetical protein [Prescottella agglutinans]|uniref:Uncharacterized protein n=1 Tax=Prescottella agglutinans TaxID=1644129 RepID=A0ABT6MG83_9NOCA|nr:hypothetical protein [Prescottella agglutinans]MDH6283240.1 hypothetical protein [Prescottella agglutinans]